MLLTILISMHFSCDNGRIKQHDKTVITNTKHTESSIDSTFWMKPTKGIRGIFEDSKRNLWFSSTEFVCRFDGAEFKYFTEADGLKSIGLVHEDQNRKIWIESGFEAYSFDGERFTSHTLTPDTTGNKWEASDQDLWFQKGIPRFGKSDSPPGVYRNHNGDIEFLPFTVPKTNKDDSRYHPTTKAIKGKDGMIWFGTMEVVIGFNKGSFTLIDREKMGRLNDPQPVGIRGIWVDSVGNLWMADNGSGVFVYDGETTINFTKLHHLDKGDVDGNTLHRAFSIAEDDIGNMWFGTVYSGIWQYDGESLTNYSDEDGVISDNIWTIYKTKQGELLFAGENPGAVYKFNGISFDRIY